MKPKPISLGVEYADQFKDPAVAQVYRKRPAYPDATFDKLAELIPATNQTVLDLGAGTGEIAIPLANVAASVDAVEPSAAMRRVGQSVAGPNNLHWFDVAAEAFDYSTTYGLVVCAQSLHWMDWEVLFTQLPRAVDRDGYLAIVALSELADERWKGELHELFARYSTNRDFVRFDLIRGLQERGLLDVEGRFEETERGVEQNIDDFVESIHARSGFSRDRMSVHAAAAFDASVRELLSSYHPRGVIEGEIVVRIWWGKPMPPPD